MCPSLGWGRFKQTAVQVHKTIVNRDDEIISMVPRLLGPDTQPEAVVVVRLW